jgi:hypothetical protein
VLDPRGRPLAGIPVYVALACAKGYVLPDLRFLSVAGPDAEGGRREARRYGDITATGPDGAYRLDTEFTRRLSSQDGHVRVVPIHPSWMEPRVATGEEGGDIRVEPAASLSVRVVGEEGDPLPEFRALVQSAARGPERRFVAATAGGFVVQWRRREGIPDEVEASLLIWARGRATASQTVTIPADRDAGEVTVVLPAVRPDGMLLLRPASRGEEAAGTGMVVVLALPAAPEEELLRVRMSPGEEGDPGTFRAALPPGRFRVRAFRMDPARDGWVVDEEIEIPSGESVERIWMAPAEDPSR